MTSNKAGAGIFQGGSTVTQQLYDVRRESNGTRRERTISRKVSQAAWATTQEVQRSKCEILSEYLGHIYWGLSYYGLDSAATDYFQTSREHFTPAQSSYLVER